MDKKIVSVNNLRVYIYTNRRCNKAVDGVSFNIKKGKILGMIGESGCGKSITASAIMQLLPELSRIEEGEIIYHSEKGDIRVDQLEKNGERMRSIRGGEIAMIFQDPMTALNPVYTVGFQIIESLIYHTKMTKKEARAKTIELLREMGIPSPEKRVDEYPYQYSGGMRQRAMIAMAMACNPKVLIADEPTTALDVTIQAQIFDLMEQLREQYDTSIMLITHDMGVISELADDVVVMYMGNAVESGSVEEILKEPAHPYTRALLKCVPVLGRAKNQVLEPIKGVPPDPYDRPPGCQFFPRCDYNTTRCLEVPRDFYITDTHCVRCWLYGSDEVYKNEQQ